MEVGALKAGAMPMVFGFLAHNSVYDILRWMVDQMDGLVGGRMDKRIDEWVDRWDIGWMKTIIPICNLEKKRSKKQGRKGKIYPFECRVPKNSKEITKPSSVINAKQ